MQLKNLSVKLIYFVIKQIKLIKLIKLLINKIYMNKFFIILYI